MLVRTAMFAQDSLFFLIAGRTVVRGWELPRGARGLAATCCRTSVVDVPIALKLDCRRCGGEPDVRATCPK